MNCIPLIELLRGRDLPTQIYTGLEHGCRCGCYGNYFERGSKGFSRAFNKALKLNPIVHAFADYAEMTADCDARQRQMNALMDEGIAAERIAYTELADQQKNEFDGTVRAIADEKGGWIDICLGNGKTITFCYK